MGQHFCRVINRCQIVRLVPLSDQRRIIEQGIAARLAELKTDLAGTLCQLQPHGTGHLTKTGSGG